MKTVSTILEDVIRRHSTTLKCAAIIHSTGQVTDRVGDFSEVDQLGLASAVLGPYGDPEASFQLAAQHENDRRMLPQGMAQGDLFALIDKPRTEFVVVVFGRKARDFNEHLEHRRNIAKTVLELFAATNDEQQ